MLSLILASALASNGGISVALSPHTPDLGGVLAPAALGPGTMALYGMVGAPELAVGYRQGFSALELEARAAFDLFQASGLVEAGVKVPVLRSGRVQIAAGGLLGLKVDSGARFADAYNFASVALQPRALAAVSLEASEVVALLARAELPLAVSLNVAGVDFRPLLSAGAELRLGEGLSLLVLGQVGADFIRTPDGLATSRPAWGLQFGLGYRVF
jgi:hypothetical protein